MQPTRMSAVDYRVQVEKERSWLHVVFKFAAGLPLIAQAYVRLICILLANLELHGALD